MIGENDLYKQAIENIKMLVQDVIEQCEEFTGEFAEDYDYEQEWVFTEFKKEFDKAIKKGD